MQTVPHCPAKWTFFHVLAHCMQCAAPAEHWAAFLCSTFSVISDAILHLLLREIYPCWHSTLVNVCTEEDEDDPYFDSSAFFSSIKLPWNYLNRRKRSMRWSYEDFFLLLRTRTGYTLGIVKRGSIGRTISGDLHWYMRIGFQPLKLQLAIQTWQNLTPKTGV